MIFQVMSYNNPERKSIMVMDKDLDLLRLLTDSLGAEGYDITLALDEEDDCALMDMAGPDMVIMKTPVFSGENLRTLDSIREYSGVPFIIITGEMDIDTLKNAFDRGADDIIRLPLNPGSFIARLHARLRRRNLSRNYFSLSFK